MASPAAVEDHSNTKTEEGTMAFHKKRSRRVSFAENTSVHIFDRDEESGTPSGAVRPNSPNEDLGFSERDSESRQFFRDEEDDDGEDEDGDMHDLGPRSPFVRVLGSPSPSSGGSTIGSATSNDEANFFGPVSTSFIRRDLSDSDGSDDNHDQTMDSTAFNLHYRSIAGSESGDLKTSTGIPLSFEEKTPNSSLIPSNTSSMVLTVAKKPDSEPDIPTSKLSSGSQSNDMSLVGEYHNKYNYGKLSPALNALLAEDHNDLHMVSHISVIKSPVKDGNQFLSNKENGSGLMDLSYNQDDKMQDIISHDEINEAVSVQHNETGVPDDGFELSSREQSAFGVLSNTIDNQAYKPLTPKHSVGGTLSGINSELLATSQTTPSNPTNTVFHLDNIMEKENKFPLIGSISHLTPRTVTPSYKQTIVFPKTDSLQRGGNISSIRKSISKLRILEASPFSAALNAKLQDSNLRSVISISKMTPLTTLLEKNNKISYIEDPLPSSVTNMDYNNNNNNNTEITPKNFKGDTQLVVQQIQPNVSADIGNGYENMIGSPQISNRSSKKLNEKTSKFNVSPHRDEEQPIQHDASLKFVEKSCQKNLADHFARSPSKNNNNDSLHEENVESSCVNQLVSNEVVNSTERKRKNEDLNTEKIAKIKISSNCGLEIPNDCEMSSIGPNLEHLAKIYTTFFKETKLLSNSVEKMNVHAIDRLVDIVGQLQRSKTYQLLSNEIQSQNPSSNIQHKRVAETKLLLCKIVHEKAKLQLLLVKQAKLLKNKQIIASGIQDYEAIKLNLSSQKSQDVGVITKNIQECQVDNNKVTSMKQTVKDINERISNLTKSFNISCKIKEVNPSDAIAFVNDHLMKRAHCQLIRKYMQLWVLADFKSSKDHYDVALNYLDLLSQRLTVTAGVVTISNISNEENIQKIFKDINASTAFGFVFDAGPMQKNVGTTNMAQEIHMTSQLLGNLVDVIEEIQVARIELKNLIYARFQTVLGKRLGLELYFFDSNSRNKATVTLNTSCLKSGIYPSEIVAFQINIPGCESQTPFSQKLSNEIAAAVQDLKVGFLRILRVCRCVSQLVSQPSR